MYYVITMWAEKDSTNSSRVLLETSISRLCRKRIINGQWPWYARLPEDLETSLYVLAPEAISQEA